MDAIGFTHTGGVLPAGPNRAAAYVVTATAGIAGLGSLVLFVLFLSNGGSGLFDLKMGWHSVLAWDAALCLLFFLQHSFMVRRRFRNWLSGRCPRAFHGVIYTIASAVALTLLGVCWQRSNVDLIVVEGAAVWLVRALVIASAFGILWGIRALRHFDAFGVQAVLSHMRGEPLAVAPFMVRGPYRWVRHPLYSCGIVAIWACPVLSLDRLLLALLFTGWIVIGARFEERDLLWDFGDVYRDYQRKVPMLIPWRGPVDWNPESRANDISGRLDAA